MLNDLRHATRAFLRTPGFTAVAVLTLALGIGATTAIFSVVNAVLLEPLPYAEADRLVVAHLSVPDFQDLRAASTSFEDTAVWASNQYNVRTGDQSRQMLGGVITKNLLPLLGVQPLLGRNFTAEDARQDTVILGYGLWQRWFGGDPAVLGRTVDLSGTSYTVIGVTPAWFRFPSAEFQLWTPLVAAETKTPSQLTNRALRIFNAVARLKPGVTIQQAQAETTAISADLARTYPLTNADIAIEIQPLYEQLVGAVRPALRILLGTVGLLLLIACANVANLMLARTTVREREMSIRMALGAGRGRLVRQLATESLLLALGGGAIGLLVAMWGVDLLPSVLEARLPRADGIRVNGQVMIFAFGATLLTAAFFGIAPALHAASGPAASLKEGSRGVVGSMRGRRLRGVIAGAEIALAVVVLVGAGLLVRSFVALTDRDPGFTAHNLLSFNVQFVKLPDGPSRAQAAAAVMERISQLPGVDAAGAATGFPTVTAQRGTRFEIEGRTLTPDESGALFIAATPGYFSALRTPVLRGRAIDAHDTAGAQPVVVINATLANRLFPNQDPTGRRLRLVNPEQTNEWRTIVGVVGDVLYQSLDAEPNPTVYTSFAQTPFMWAYVMVRMRGAPDALIRSIPSVVSSVDPTLTAANLRTMEQVVSASVAEPRFNMLLTAWFAVLALVLAAIGIYGVIAYSVAQRTQEIGIRMALGAGAASVLRLVLSEGLIIASAGIVVGLAGALAVTRIIAHILAEVLYGVTPRDPLTFSAGAALLLAAALLACYIPARRATRVDPMTALRTE
jgi:putative ABC transport system permease protein